jgi:hypothetical protein
VGGRGVGDLGRGKRASRVRRERRGVRLVGTGRDIFVLGTADQRENGGDVSRGVAKRPVAVERHFKEAVAEEDELLGTRQHLEVGRETGFERLVAQDAVAERMKRVDPRISVAVGDEFVDTAFHFGGGFLSEREGEDLRWFRLTGRDQPRDAPRDHRRLARPRAGDDQQRSIAVGDGGLLLWGESGERAVDGIRPNAGRVTLRQIKRELSGEKRPEVTLRNRHSLPLHQCLPALEGRK